MEMPHLLEDPRFSTGFQRLARAAEFDELVKPWFKTKTKKEIVALCQEWRVPAAPVNEIPDLLQEAQYQARNYWVELDHPVAGRHLYPGPPFKMSETRLEYNRAPLLGEHNEEIYLQRLGLSPKEMEQLKPAGVL